jgi:hypothetical protein
MVAARRHDRQGRSSSQPVPRDKKFVQIPAPFAPIPLEVMQSDAFRTLGIHARRVLDVLGIEHVAHRFLENGRLVATYDQLERAHIPRRKIRGAIAELETRGLIRRMAVGSGNRRTGDRQPSLYRLTFLGSVPDRMGPTDEWRSYVAPKPARKTHRPVSLSDIGGCHTVAPRRVSHGGTP